MSSRNFEMRMSCAYEGSKNNVLDLYSEVLQKGEWQAFELNASSPWVSYFRLCAAGLSAPLFSQ